MATPQRWTRIALVAAVGFLGGAVVLFAWPSPAPRQAAVERLQHHRAGVSIPPTGTAGAHVRSADATDAGETDDPDQRRKAEFKRVSDQAFLGCLYRSACTAAVFHAAAGATADPELAQQFHGMALQQARRTDDEALWQDLLIARGTGRSEPELERTMAQGWGRFLAARAPRLQEEVVKAAVWVTPDSPLHEPLAWLGGYPACDVDPQRGWVACAPQGR